MNDNHNPHPEIADLHVEVRVPPAFRTWATAQMDQRGWVLINDLAITLIFRAMIEHAFGDEPGSTPDKAVDRALKIYEEALVACCQARFPNGIGRPVTPGEDLTHVPKS